jgi:hypothetical protein
MITIREAALAAIRLMDEGMSLKHAVQLVAGTYSLEPDQLYRKIALIQEGK